MLRLKVVGTQVGWKRMKERKKDLELKWKGWKIDQEPKWKGDREK